MTERGREGIVRRVQHGRVRSSSLVVPQHSRKGTLRFIVIVTWNTE